MLEKTTGKLVVLSNEVSEDSPFSPGARTNYANDIDIARDGTIYFTTSTDKPVIYNVEGGFLDTFHTFVLDLLQVSFMACIPTDVLCGICHGLCTKPSV